MILDIVLFGDPILRKKCRPIEEITEEIKQLALHMIETIDKKNGIGLAAPQVGHDIRMFVLRKYIDRPDGSWGVSEPRVYINPVLHSPSDKLWTFSEKCLSLPGISGVPVARPYGISIEATDLFGKKFVEEEEGHNARVLMHENDHLNGVLHIDRTDEKSKHKIEGELAVLKKKYLQSKKK